MGDVRMAVRHARYASVVVAAGLTAVALLAHPSAAVGTAPGPTAASSMPTVPVPTGYATSGLPQPAVVATPTSAAAAASAAAPETSTAPSGTPTVVAVSDLTASGIPVTALEAYQRAAAGAPCSVDW